MMKYLFYDFVKITAALPGLIAFRPKILYENEEAKKKIKGGALIIANHITLIDPIHVMTAVWYRRHRFICTKDFFEHKIAKHFFKGFRCIPIDKENMGMDSFNAIVKCLKDGELVSMFPEGKVSKDSSVVDTFKSGMILMAVRGRTPIIPIYIKKRENILQRQVTVIGEPVHVETMFKGMPSMKDIEEVSNQLHNKEEELKNYANRNKRGV